jgi:hypothetical protein
VVALASPKTDRPNIITATCFQSNVLQTAYAVEQFILNMFFMKVDREWKVVDIRFSDLRKLN